MHVDIIEKFQLREHPKCAGAGGREDEDDDEEEREEEGQVDKKPHGGERFCCKRIEANQRNKNFAN